MKKVIVIGCPGSGKTTFAEKLHKCTELPLIYLDAIWHKGDRTHITREDFDKKLAEILGGDRWIIDGNYSRTIETRLTKCDTVFLFDLPMETCMQGAVARLGKRRKDMPWVDTELDPILQREIEGFSENVLPTIYELLEKYKENKKIVIFKSRKEADLFLKEFGREEY